MALNASDKDTLEEIIRREGKCLDAKLCERCPFRSWCLPDFLNPNPPSPPQRLQKAVDVITHHCLIDSEIEVEDINKDSEWDQR